MNELKEILVRIVDSACAVALNEDDLLSDKLNDRKKSQKLSRAIGEELGVEITPAEIAASRSLVQLTDIVSERLLTNFNGQTLVDIYRILEQLVEDHLSQAINYHWHATWIGDLLHESDSLEDVEIVMSIEQKFGFSISNPDAQAMQTVGETVQYLWCRSCEQSFVPRPKPLLHVKEPFCFTR
ncbi:MAG TPA: hypothetical protein VFI24_07075 [Pyrinomonadaceae bacterium]|nr:hypothetical protein [Pyrinomonadaceae bacterium]